MARGGRKSAYITKVEPRLEEIKAWARDGYTEHDMCKALGVSVPSFIKYKKEQVNLFNALKVNKAIADQTVENSLYMRANGYETQEEKITTNPDGSKKIEITKKKVAPDTTACIFWLKNRKPKEWRDKQEIEHSGEIEQSVVILPSNGRMMKEIPDGSVKPKELICSEK